MFHEEMDKAESKHIIIKRQFPYEKLITHKYPLSKLNEIMKAPEKGYILDGKESLKIVVSGELK